jgi:hypothetical protein
LSRNRLIRHCGKERLRERNKPEPTDKIFGPTNRDLLNAILDELRLKFDRDGNRRTAYSLRHTYICMRLIEGADIYQIAKNCRTSVEMIETFYPSHIKNTLDAAAINVKKGVISRERKQRKNATSADDHDQVQPADLASLEGAGGPFSLPRRSAARLTRRFAGAPLGAWPLSI